jgi:hypothetical protein
MATSCFASEPSDALSAVLQHADEAGASLEELTRLEVIDPHIRLYVGSGGTM